MDFAEYRVDHTYAHGVLESSAYVRECNGGDNGETILSVVDQTIDPDTGLVVASRDPTGLETTYDYDLQGRLVEIDPADDARTLITYTAATPNAAARVEVDRVDSSGTALVESRTLFDGYGRVCVEQERQPDGSWNRKQQIYFATGVLDTVSEVEGVGSLVETKCPSTVGPPYTRFQEYDPFGRSKRVVPADGQTHEVKFAFFGERVKRRRVKIATSESSETEEKFTRRYDAQGRLSAVVEFSGDSDVTTTYAYDSADRLKTVSVQLDDTAQDQVRTFTYDGRGFLTSEQQPELGAAGNGVVHYLYDSRGHLRQLTDEARDLSYRYDQAERLTRVWDETAGRPLKEFAFNPTNRPGQRDLGKLRTAKRHNYVSFVDPIEGTDPVINLIVTEHFDYAGTEGRLSKTQTRMTIRGEASVFDQSYGYDPLGNLTSLTYPQCRHALCDGQDPSRTVQYLHNRGLLSEMPGYAGTITYHPNSLLRNVAHANGVIDTWHNDPNDMARPRQIFASGSASWDSGLYQYDGTGNVKAIGTDTYVYDKVGRLKRANVNTQSHTRAYTYDPHGNLESITRDGVASNLELDSTTNRLTDPFFYDAAGNLVRFGTPALREYAFDPLNTMISQRSGDQASVYVYTAEDRRLLTVDLTENPIVAERWTLRGPGGKVLREYTHSYELGVGSDAWQWTKDYIHRGAHLLASDSSKDGVRHYHVDHLGSPRLITDGAGEQVSYHVYFPFGEEATDPFQDDEALKFTGHERDRNGDLATSDDLDYMMARYCSPLLGRFLSIDPGASQDPENPQTWNRYSYVLNSPMVGVDPTGEITAAQIAETATHLLVDGKERALEDLSDGTLAGIATAKAVATAADVIIGVVSLLNAGQATGEALGSQAGTLATAKAFGKDTLLVVGIATGAAGLARGAATNLARESGKGLVTPRKFFGNKTASEAREILGKKFGPPRSSRPGADTFYNPKTGRSFNVHTDPAHGPPHVDIRRRGPYPDRKVLLQE